LSRIPQPPYHTLFPYTTLFRSTDSELDVSESLRPFLLPTQHRWAANRAGSAVDQRHNLGPRDLVPTDSELDVSESNKERLQRPRSEEHTSELQSRFDLVCRLLL